MGSICNDLLEACLGDGVWSGALLDRAIAEDDGRALLTVVVERLGDLFEPHLSEVYDRLFTQVIARIAPALMPRVRPSPSSAQAPPSANRVYVLSRVTLGADVAVTSVLIDAAKRRYPHAEIVFVGSRKSYELFEADPRVRHQAAPYARSGALVERLRSSAALWFDDGLVFDPDSRLTQLGLLRVCDDSNYFFFPSRAYGSDSDNRLPDLAAHWAREVFDIENARPYIAPLPAVGEAADITVSLGVGQNESKRIEGDFERDLIGALAATGASVLVDTGGTPEERARVESVIRPGVRTHKGAFAPFAAEIARSKLYVGYDSAGGHVASACEVPVISIAKGFVSDRMAARWRPRGIVIDGNAPDVLDRITAFTCTFRR